MKPLKDYSFVRGVCYNPDPKKTEEQLKREIGYCQRLQLNSIRFWMSMMEYEKNPIGYLDRLERFVQIIGENGINVMPILWNGNIIRDFQVPDQNWYDRAGKYAAGVIERFQDKKVLLMWDVMNEPMCNDYIKNGTAKDRNLRFEKIQCHVRKLCEIVRNLDPINAITVGHEQVEHCESTADLVDVISYHDYKPTRRAMEETICKAESLHKRWNKPILNTETGCVGRANPYEAELELAQKYHIGWYLFNLVCEGFWGDIHGIVYPDGTIRDPATIAAIFGFFRNRSESRIQAEPNKEGHAEQAVKAVQSVLKVVPTTLFHSKQVTSDDILDAAEYCVNILESAELIPMWDPPSVKLANWRRQPEEERDLNAIKHFAYDMAEAVKKACCIL